MKTPLRILRARTFAILRPDLRRTPRQVERHERIIEASRVLMAEFGRHALRFNDLADTMEIASSTLRRHFADLDELLGVILLRHLTALTAVLAAIKGDSAAVQAARRAIYFKSTRLPGGGFTPDHVLVVRDRLALPADVSEKAEAARAALGILLAGDAGEMALALLDAPGVTLARVEMCLAPLLAEKRAVPARAEKHIAPAIAPAQRTPAAPAPRPLNYAGPRHAAIIDAPLPIPPPWMVPSHPSATAPPIRARGG
jgi:AcrR family transcriptional regulator